MEWGNLTTEGKLLKWKELRNLLEQCDFNKKEVCRVVSTFWKYVPRYERRIDYYTPSSWPSPWEILEYDLLCNSGVSLMMYYTLRLVHVNYDLDLYVINDESSEFLVLDVDSELLLNFDTNDAIYTNEANFTIIQKFSKKELPMLI